MFSVPSVPSACVFLLLLGGGGLMATGAEPFEICVQIQPGDVTIRTGWPRRIPPEVRAAFSTPHTGEG